MPVELPRELAREALTLLVTLGAPMLGVLLLVGLIVGIAQATTQVNDSAIGFVPRILAGLAVVWGLGAWMLERLSGFLTSAFERMGSAVL